MSFSKFILCVFGGIALIGVLIFLVLGCVWAYRYVCWKIFEIKVSYTERRAEAGKKHIEANNHQLEHDYVVKALVTAAFAAIIMIIAACVADKCFDLSYVGKENVVLTFVGILATFIVVTNYAQVVEIKNEMGRMLSQNNTIIDTKLSAHKTEIETKLLEATRLQKGVVLRLQQNEKDNKESLKRLQQDITSAYKKELVEMCNLLLNSEDVVLAKLIINAIAEEKKLTIVLKKDGEELNVEKEARLLWQENQNQLHVDERSCKGNFDWSPSNIESIEGMPYHPAAIDYVMTLFYFVEKNC